MQHLIQTVDSDKNNSEATEEFGPQIQDSRMTKQVEEESTMANLRHYIV